VTASFNVDAHNLGYIDPAREPSVKPDIKAGTKLDLPYWMVQPLSKRNWVDFAFPKVYGRHFREVLTADSSPQVVSLHDKIPFFEEAGCRMAIDVLELHQQEQQPPEQAMEAKEVCDTLKKAIVNRSQQLLDLSENSSGEDTSRLLKGLTEREKQLFAIGQQSSRQFQLWKVRDVGQITKVGSKRVRGM